MAVNVAYSKGKPVTAAETPRTMPQLNQKRRSPRFLVVANPASWEFAREDAEEGGEWVPVVKCLPVRAGVGGATSNGERVIDAGFRTALANDGWVDLTHDPRLVNKYGSLIHRHEQQDGGNHYAPPWQELGVVGGKARKRYDMPLFRDVQRSVIGIIGPMAAEVLEDTTARLRARLGQYRMDRTGGPNIVRLIERAEADLAAMEAAWERQFAEKPKTRKTTKAVADE